MLLAIHITGGVLALLSGAVAIAVQARHGPHRVHVVAGRCFVVGMIMVVVAAIPLSVIVHSTLLFLIAVFSGYLMLVGWRLAKNRTGLPGAVDWGLDALMLAGSATMVVVGVLTLAGDGIILLVFGILGALLAAGHLRSLRRQPIRGRARIGSHLQFMIAAFIAAVTAFLVVQGFLGIFGWFLPTVVLTPVIVVWKRKIAAGAKTTLDAH